MVHSPKIKCWLKYTMSFNYEEAVIQFVDEHFDKIGKEEYMFIQNLYEYVSFMYDGSVDEETITSASSNEESEDDCVVENIKVNIDDNGFYSMDMS